MDMRRSKALKDVAITSNNPSTSINVLSKLNEIQNCIEDIKTENKDVNLKQEIKELKEVVFGQNKIMVDLLSEIHVLVKSNLSTDTITTKYLDKFPIKSTLDLEEIEMDISPDTLDALISTIKKIVGKDGIKKKLTSIFDPNLLLEFNVEGRQNKKRLLDYPKIMNAIYKSVYKEEMLTKKYFLAEIRKAIRLSKNRFYKDACLRKKVQHSFLTDDHSNCSSNVENRTTCSNSKEKTLTFIEL